MAVDYSALPGLRVPAATKHFRVGMAMFEGDVITNTPFVVAETNVLCSTHVFKQIYLQPTEGVFQYTEPEQIIALAQANDQEVKAHVLVYDGSAQASWLNTYLNTANRAGAQGKLYAHIDAVLAHFAGRVKWWEVANECFLAADGKVGGFRNSRWFRAYGDGSYLQEAFVRAHAADPLAKLGYNETVGRYATATDIANRANILAWVDTMQNAGAPLHWVGFQCHMQPDTSAILHEPSLIQYFNDLGDRGLPVHITECNVDDHDIVGTPLDTRDAIVASRHERIFRIIRQCPNVQMFIEFGVTDDHSGFDISHPRADGLPQRPLLLGPSGVRKAAWFGAYQMLTSLTDRNPAAAAPVMSQPHFTGITMEPV